MRSPAQMDSLAIEITNACVMKCSNCTRFAGHHLHPFFMTLEQFKEAVDSLDGYQGIVGIQGAEPLLHPKFVEFSEYAASKVPRERLGLWSTFPEKFNGYREVIARCYGAILLNDHSRSDILHAPVLVAISETAPDDFELFQLVDKCWVQNNWSASISPKGAYFCEVASSLAHLFEGSDGWKVEPGWWKRVPKDFTSQMEEFCRKCGCAMPLIRRPSVDERDDISPGNLELLRGKSRKVAKGEYVLTDWEVEPLPNNGYPDQVYQDYAYRDAIAAKYGIALIHKDGWFDEPVLMESLPPRPKPLFEIFQEIA